MLFLKPYSTLSGTRSGGQAIAQPIFAAMLIVILASATVRPAVAADAATPPKKAISNPTINVEVSEWAVFVADVVNPELNARNLFHDGLPPFAEDLRTAPPTDDSQSSQPSPVGLIRISAAGPIDTEGTIDVQLGFKGGRVLGHWPRAQIRSGGLLWQDLRIAPKTGEPRRLPEGSWLAQLRGGESALLSGTTRESFLLYDVELPYPMAIQVKALSGSKYFVAHGMDAPLLDLTFYKRDGENHWRTASIASLSKAAGFPKPNIATPVAAAKADPTNPTFTYTPRTVNGALIWTPTIHQATDAEPASPTAVIPPSASIKGTEFALGPATATNDTVLAAWRGKLADAGVSSSDQDVVLKILARQALDPKRLTAIYRIDPAELDRILPSEIVPQPKKSSRIALVVVRGIDPAINDELDDLITKLGDPSWKIRESATNEIKRLGVRAKQRLEQAAKNKDVEIAFRAEKLLAAISNAADHATDNAGNAASQAIGGAF